MVDAGHGPRQRHGHHNGYHHQREVPDHA
jgi:hypothetical protein